jgi:hypothetical protein
MPEQSDREAITAAVLARRDEIYRLRGQIVSGVIELESSVDAVMTTYFGQTGVFIMRFRSWVLSRLSLSEKIEVLKEVVDELGIKERALPTLTALRRASDVRNNLAHSSVTVNTMSAEGRTLEEMLRWQSARQSRQGFGYTAVEIDELERDAVFVRDLGYQVFRLLVAVVARLSGRDPFTAVDELDAANPHLTPLPTDVADK